MAFDSRPERIPRLTIGIPVHNGENYLERSLETLLAQSFDDFEVLVSDNCSTDATADIVEKAAAADPRVHLHVHDRNQGMAPNFNFLVDQCRTELFKWAAHDDEYDPEFLEACVAALDRRPEASLAYTATVDIDADGELIGPADEPPRADGDDVVERFASLLRPRQAFQIFAVMRTDVLRATGRQRHFPDGDLVTIAELALHGPFAYVDRPLFRRREHPDRSMRKLRSARERVAFFDTSRTGRVTWPAYRLGWEYLQAVWSAPLTPAERRGCLARMGSWLRCYAPDLVRCTSRSSSLLAARGVERLRTGRRPHTLAGAGAEPAASSVDNLARTSPASVAATTAVPATRPSWTRR